MANHVHSYISFYSINEAATEKLRELVGRVRQDNGYRWFGDLFVDGENLTYEQSEKYEWTTDFIGPKWCYIEDLDIEDEAPYYMVTESAWIPPEQGLGNLLDILKELDPNMVTSITYEDEMPNFVGWSVYKGSDMEDGCELDENEIPEMVFNSYPHLRDHWDKEEAEWKTDEEGNLTEESESAMDEYNDMMYEMINTWQDEGVDSYLKWLEEHGDEE